MLNTWSTCRDSLGEKDAENTCHFPTDHLFLSFSFLPEKASTAIALVAARAIILVIGAMLNKLVIRL